MSELTRIYTVEITCISTVESETKEEASIRIAKLIQDATNADSVKVTKVQDFIFEKE